MMESRGDWIKGQCLGTVLDVGSADGWIFGGSGLDVTLLDINEFPPDEFPRVVGDAHDLPFEDNSFDCCVLGEILEHVHNPILVLREAARVARGKVIFTVPDEHHWSEDHKPLWTIERQIKVTGKNLTELFMAGNPTCVKINNIRQSYHNRWYTKEMLESQLDYLGLPYQIQTIAYDGWSWLCGTVSKEEEYDRFSWTRNKIEELTKGNLNAQIVDIGCKECPITRELPNCTWVDIESYEAIAELMRTMQVRVYRSLNGKFTPPTIRRDISPTLIPKDKFVQANAENLPFSDKQFDVAVATELLEHVGDPVAVLKEVKRVAKQAIITVPNEYDWAPEYQPFAASPHVRFYTEETLKQHLEEAGITNYKFGRLDYKGWSQFTVVTEEETTLKDQIVPSASIIKYETLAQPRSLHIDTFPFCNAKCKFCRYHTLTRARAKMDMKLLEHILDDAASWPKPLQEIVAVHYGELFLDPDWYDTLKMMESKLPQTGIVVPTNGSLLDQATVEKLATIKTLSIVNFSVNAFFHETYQELMGLEAENIPKIKQAINRLKVLRPSVRIWVSMVYGPVYQTEVERDLFIEEWRHYTPEVYAHPASYCHDYFKPAIKSKVSCRSIFIDFIILSDGRVCPCCWDSDGSIIVGDVTREKILDIWHGTEMNSLRQLHNSGRRDEVPLCSECTFG